MVVLAGLIVQGADLGGRMVFQHGVGVGKKNMIQATSHEGSAHGHEETKVPAMASGREQGLHENGHGEHGH
jgi:hypothetical protein